MPQSSYDVLSDARTDDRDIQFVSKLAKELERAFQSRTGRRLRIFVDTREIATAEIWQESIRNALENSTVMVAALTPSYFTSEWCGREWDHFRHGRLADFLDEALKRKRRQEGPTAFWSSIRLIFASESLLPLVRDELDEQFPDRDAAIKVRFQRVGRGRRAVASFFLLSNHPNQRYW